MLDLVDSAQKVKVMPLLGQRFPIATAPGQIFLAFEADAGSPAGPRKDAVELPAPVLAEFEAIRARGFSIDEHGFGEGVTCLAVPLFNGKSDVAAALAILGPSYRMTGERIDHEVLLPLREAGGAISAGLGYLSDYLSQYGVS